MAINVRQIFGGTSPQIAGFIYHTNNTSDFKFGTSVVHIGVKRHSSAINVPAGSPTWPPLAARLPGMYSLTRDNLAIVKNCTISHKNQFYIRWNKVDFTLK